MVIGIALQHRQSLFQDFAPLCRARKFFKAAIGTDRPKSRQGSSLLGAMFFPQGCQQALEVDRAGTIAQHACGKHFNRIVGIRRHILRTPLKTLR